MEEGLSNLSGGLVLRGVIAIIFGIAATFWPGITLVTLVYLFSAFVLFGGLVDVVEGIGRLVGDGSSVMIRILLLLFGFVQIGVGVYLLRHPHVAFATLILLIGFTFIVRGVVEVVHGVFDGGPSATYRAVMIIVGLIAVIAGVVVLLQPAASGVAFVWILGIYSLITGPLLIAAAQDINKLNRDASAVARNVRAAR
jgi:uncharacterized membrane protein HdeD (DUF308 family)